MSGRDDALGHKSHRSLVADHPYERHITPLYLGSWTFCQERGRKILPCHLDLYNTWAHFPRRRNVCYAGPSQMNTATRIWNHGINISLLYRIKVTNNPVSMKYYDILITQIITHVVCKIHIVCVCSWNIEIILVSYEIIHF